MANGLVPADQPGRAVLVSSAVRNNKLPACTLHRAETYREAIDLIQQTPFQVGLLNYILSQPGPHGAKTGLDIARELRRALGTCRTDTQTGRSPPPACR